MILVQSPANSEAKKDQGFTMVIMVKPFLLNSYLTMMLIATSFKQLSIAVHSDMTEVVDC